MKVAVLGAGFCGLAAAFFAQQKGYTVTIYDPNGIGGGASGVASGLLHPYPGEKARLSEDGEEAFTAAKKLLNEAGPSVFVAEGIDRYPVSEEQKALFAERAQQDPRMAFDGEKLTFLDGITVFARPYLARLHELCSAATFVQESLPETAFSNFDAVIVAVGAGIRHFSWAEQLPLRYVKGQVLRVRRPSWVTRSLVAKGYIATTNDPAQCIVGSTYEHDYASDTPDQQEAEQQIIPRIRRFLPFQVDFDVLGCEAGVRVANRNHYRPLIAEVSSRVFVLTGMGSRGLLYHALFAKRVVDRL